MSENPKLVEDTTKIYKFRVILYENNKQFHCFQNIVNKKKLWYVRPNENISLVIFTSDNGGVFFDTGSASVSIFSIGDFTIFHPAPSQLVS